MAVDLGPHDFSMLLHWLGEPVFVRAIGRDSVGSGQLDVAFIDMGMRNGALVHMELSCCLRPSCAARCWWAAGRCGLQDTSNEQVRVHDRGVEVLEPQSFGEHQLSYRTGDILTPRLDIEEPLRAEMADFVGAIREGREPVSRKKEGLDVVRSARRVVAGVQRVARRPGHAGRRPPPRRLGMPAMDRPGPVLDPSGPA